MSNNRIIFDIPFIGLAFRMQYPQTPLQCLNVLEGSIKILEQSVYPTDKEFAIKYKRRSDRLKVAIKLIK